MRITCPRLQVKLTSQFCIGSLCMDSMPAGMALSGLADSCNEFILLQLHIANRYKPVSP